MYNSKCISYVDALACIGPVSQLLTARSRVAAMRRVGVRGKLGFDAAQQFLHSFFRFGGALCLSVSGRVVLVHVRKEAAEAIRGFVIMNCFVGGSGIVIAGAKNK